MATRFSAAYLARSLVICGVVALLALLVGAALGEQSLDLREARVDGSVESVILFSVRLPRVLLAALVGAALAASGAMLQSLLRNPLADPFVLGTSGGAALGATVALAFGATTDFFPPVAVMALAGALGATALVLTVGRLTGGDASTSTLLAGVIFNAFALAAITFIKALVAPDKLGEILFWLAGKLETQRWSTLGVAAVVVLFALGLLTALSPRLNLLSLGEEDARSLGVDVARTRLVLLVTASLGVAAAVSLSGLVGFVGLLVPHLARLLFGADQRVTLPASALLGAAFLVLADLAARLLFRVFSTEPPVGVITSLLGGPLFLLLLARRR